MSPVLSVEQSTVQNQARLASLSAIRLIMAYMVCDLLVVTLYPAAKIYKYFYRNDIAISYSVEFMTASFISLQVVWVCLLFRAFSAIAVGARHPSQNKSSQVNRPSLRCQAASPTELALKDAQTNIIIR